MSRLTMINPAAFAPPKGYSNGVVGEGKVLFVAGQIGWNAQCQFESSDFIHQFAQTLDNILTVVQAAGGQATDIAQMTAYITDIHEYRVRAKELGPVWKEKLGRHFPAMALVQVVALVEPQAKVEISAMCILAQPS